MTAKTNTERQRAFRADLKRQGLTEVRGIFAKPEQHKAIKEAAKAINTTGETVMHIAGNQTGDFNEWVRAQVETVETERQQELLDKINALILASEEADPDGYSETEFAALKSRICKAISNA